MTDSRPLIWLTAARVRDAAHANGDEFVAAACSRVIMSCILPRKWPRRAEDVAIVHDFAEAC